MRFLFFFIFNGLSAIEYGSTSLCCENSEFIRVSIMMISDGQLCPCTSNLPYQSCCQPFHHKDTQASSAEQLMRSRYSAFCLGNIEYLIATLHPDKRKTDDRQTLGQTIRQTQWLGLKIIDHKVFRQSATVEFVAFFQDQTVEQKINQLHERSTFIKEDERWFYVSGAFLPPIKLARNYLCFCGSGQKVKKCHGV